MQDLTSQSWIEVVVRVPEPAKKAVRDTLGPFVLPDIQEKRTEEGGIWSVKGIMPADTSIDDRLVNMERGLRQIEQALALDNALLVEIEKVHLGGDASKYGRKSEPVHRGGCFVVAPPDNFVQTNQDQTVLRITAGQAFGDGSHSSTRVALQIIDGLFRGHHGSPPAPGWCLDAGCGTGVLALAVAAVWKGRVLAADISPEAIRRVRTNQKSNPPWGWRVVPVLGALSCCRGPFDVILANLVPSVHVNAGQTLWETLGPGGWLVLAGFRETQNDLVAGLFLAKGAEAKACLCEEGWTGLLLRKPDVGKL